MEVNASKDGSMINDEPVTFTYTTATDTSAAAPFLSPLSEDGCQSRG